MRTCATLELDALLAEIESFRVERTESLNNTDKFCKAICAFANDMSGSGLPGYLFVGVDKFGKPTGAKIDERLLESLAGHRDSGNILPKPSVHVFKATHAGSDIAVVEVQPSDMPPVRYKQDVWIRQGQPQIEPQQNRNADWKSGGSIVRKRGICKLVAMHHWTISLSICSNSIMVHPTSAYSARWIA